MNFDKFINLEHKTDTFAKDKLGFTKEINEMLKIIEGDNPISLSLRFIRSV